MFTRLPIIARAMRRFSRARRGSAAVELALVIGPFFLLTFGLAEIAMIGFAQAALDGGVSGISRSIRTGQAQMGGMTEGQIKDTLCGSMSRLLAVDCEANLSLDIRRYASFNAAAPASPVQNGQFQDGGFQYQPGQPSEVVLVRAFYRWHVMTPMFQPVFQNLAGGDRILVSTMMFRNEPYQ